MDGKGKTRGCGPGKKVTQVPVVGTGSTQNESWACKDKQQYSRAVKRSSTTPRKLSKEEGADQEQPTAAAPWHCQLPLLVGVKRAQGQNGESSITTLF